ncbi:MAG: outer membrane lipoprotein-sorting protein [Pseudomonadota bacterium]
MLLGLLGLLQGAVVAADPEPALEAADGRTLMETVYARHRQYPYVYEEQSMVLVDRNGQKDTRRLARYSRIDDDGVNHILLHFRFPREVQGVALLARRYPDGASDLRVFLPALGHHLIATGALDPQVDARSEDHFLGTDFTIENLAGENLDDYRFERRRDARMTDLDYYVVDVFPRGASDAATPVRRHFILKDGVFITRTDHFGAGGKVRKRQSSHDLTVVNGDAWRANMLLMEDLERFHRTVIKVDRRVFSPDYVPAEVFSAAWIYANAPAPEDDDFLFEELDPSEYLRELATGLKGVGP